MHRIYNNLWNKLYVRELFEDGLRLDESVHIGEDALLNLQLYLRAKNIVHISDHTYVYRVHSSSAMAKVDTVGINTITIPLITPGMDSGRITLPNTCVGEAPKSCAASIKLWSIF